MRKSGLRAFGLLATAATLSLAAATAVRAESVIVQERVGVPMAAPGQQIVTERTIEPGLFGDQFVRERTVVTQPMVTEQTVVGPTVVTPAPRARVRQYIEPRYTVQQQSPPYQPGVTTVVSEPAYTYRQGWNGQGWNDYGTMTTTQECTIGFDGIRRCY